MSKIAKSSISEKLKYIIDESGYSLTTFAIKANKLGYPLTRQTLSSILNNKNPYPTVPILNSIVQVCHKLGNDKLKRVTFDYLLNDDILDLDAVNANYHYELGLTESSIRELKLASIPFIDHSKEINYFINNSRYHYWQTLSKIRVINDLLQYKKDHRKLDKDILKEKLKPFTCDTEIYFHLYQFNRNLVENIKQFIDKLDDMDDEKIAINLCSIIYELKLVNSSFKYDLIEYTRKMIELK